MREFGTRFFAMAGMAALAVVGLAAAQAAEPAKPYVMKLSTTTLNDSQHQWLKLFAAAVEKDSGDRIKTEIFTASQLGAMPRQIEGTQFGSIQAIVTPPEFLVGVDERFELLSASGLFKSPQQASRVVSDPEFRNAFLALGSDKGLLGVNIFISAPISILTRKPVRHLDEFKGLKIRVLASNFQNQEVSRLGASPVAMSLGDVMPALQQGAIDGSLAAVTTFAPLKYYDTAKYLTETGHYYVFSVAELSKKWFEALPPDLQKIVRDDAEQAGKEVTPWEINFIEEQRKTWTDHGGELISLPPAEQAEMMKRLSTVGEDMTKDKPASRQLYELLLAAVMRAG
jgi:TRAP-type C4-dicarboxylate transport system substrate-binding protein